MQKMKIEDLVAALRRLKVQTGSLACLGCGHEHNCSTSGCAIIRAAVDELCGMEWIDAEVELPPEDDVILCVVSGKPRTNLTLDEAIEIASYSRTDGWIVDAYPEWEGPTVTYWRPIPEPPEVG